MTKSHLESEFATAWQYFYPHIDLHSEHKFHPQRRFRFDFAHLPTKTAIEIQGGIWTRGKAAHSSGSGVQRDCHKQCLASSLGWLVFPLSEAMIRDREWIELIAKTISDRPIYTLIPNPDETPNVFVAASSGVSRADSVSRDRRKGAKC